MMMIPSNLSQHSRLVHIYTHPCTNYSSNQESCAATVGAEATKGTILTLALMCAIGHTSPYDQLNYHFSFWFCFSVVLFVQQLQVLYS